MASYVEIIRLFLSSQTLDFRKNTPAYAGNTSDPSSTIPVFRDHPRLRGEYGRLPVPLIVPVGSPPLARGIRIQEDAMVKATRITPACAGNTGRTDSLAQGLRITPACAGNTPAPSLLPLPPEDHPRLRGEYQPVSNQHPPRPGSPPLARGIHALRIITRDDVRITPACAGNTPTRSNCSGYLEDHPRLRGEYKPLNQDRLKIRGSPPLARGILLSNK